MTINDKLCSKVMWDLHCYYDKSPLVSRTYFSPADFKRYFRNYKVSIWDEHSFPNRNGVPRLCITASRHFMQYAKGMNLLQQMQISRASKYVSILCRIVAHTDTREIPKFRATQIVEYAAKRVGKILGVRYEEVYQFALHDSDLFMILYHIGLELDLHNPITCKQIEKLRKDEEEMRGYEYGIL